MYFIKNLESKSVSMMKVYTNIPVFVNWHCWWHKWNIEATKPIIVKNSKIFKLISVVFWVSWVCTHSWVHYNNSNFNKVKNTYLNCYLMQFPNSMFPFLIRIYQGRFFSNAMSMVMMLSLKELWYHLCYVLLGYEILLDIYMGLTKSYFVEYIHSGMFERWLTIN